MITRGSIPMQTTKGKTYTKKKKMASGGMVKKNCGGKVMKKAKGGMVKKDCK